MKIAGAASFGIVVPNSINQLNLVEETVSKQNILVLVFDALSALHLPLHGYPRETMPNLSRLANRAIVYHNHYSGGNYTTPGTASLLTGTLPWTHRAIVHNDTVADEFVKKNIFSAFPDYHRIAYSHNPLVNTQLKQFMADIEDYIPREAFYLDSNLSANRIFKGDEDISSVGWIRSLKRSDDGYGYSLYLSHIYDLLKRFRIKNLLNDYPRGLPNINVDDYYILEDGTTYLEQKLATIERPFLGYFHFLPPHSPYNPRKEFVGRFQGDGYRLQHKEEHLFTMHKTPSQLNKWMNQYDEFILNADHELGKLIDFMDHHGMLEDTWVIFTSDHGELFERGITGHLTPILHQPVIRVPLVIFEPGRTSRLDIYDNTSGVDILPTLMGVAGKSIPEWIEGAILPPFDQRDPSSPRNLFALQAKGIGKKDPIVKATVMLVRDQYKLMYYFGYRELEELGDYIELYDLVNDPGEFYNQYADRRDVADDMLREVKMKLAEVNLLHQ